MRENKAKYGMVALMMVIGMVGIVAALESIPTLGVLGMGLLFFICGTVLLFCLMRLEVMDFPKGSFMYEVNRQVNAPKRRVPTQHRSVNTAGKSILMKGV